METQQLKEESQAQNSPNDAVANLKSAVEAEKVATPPELADRYTYVKKLGQGAQAHVYEAIRKSDGTHVAIKQLNIDNVQNWKEYDLFWREAEILKNLNYDGVATFYETIECLEAPQPHAFIVQKCIQGKTLNEMMKIGYRFSVNRIFEIAIQLIDLLEKLHKHDPAIIHRDIKPSNIMFEPQIGDEFKLFLIDFGAVANPQVQKGGSTVAGTYGYMPPEQLMGRPEPASDIYALGATLTYMLCGVEPADMQIADFMLVIEPHLQHLPHAVVTCLRKMLIPNTAERLCDYTTLRTLFTNFTQNIFTDDIATTLTPADLDKQLRNVERLGQAGNAELWLQLSDNTPRQVPNYYKNLKTPAFTSEVALHQLQTKARGKTFKSVQLLVWAICIILIALLIAIPIVIVNLTGNANSSGFIFLIAVPVILLFGITAVLQLNTNFYKAIVSRAYAKLGHDGIQNANATIQHLIKYGRKTIATICEIKYIPIDGDYVGLHYGDESGELFDIHDETQVHENKMIYRNCAPVQYRISYKFNPPDDDNPNDLIHEITLRYNPEKTLHVGDALPILYYINPKNLADVISMPFPYPVEKLMARSDLLYRSPLSTL